MFALPRISRTISSLPVTAPTAPTTPSQSPAVRSLRAKLESFVEAYEEFIGIKAVKEAQAGVMMSFHYLLAGDLLKVRASHERERERVEKTKWWSVSASLVGAIIGIVNNKMLMKVFQAIAAIREDNARLSTQMEELARLARIEVSLDSDPNAVVYVGSDMERLLDQTEKNIESKMKLQTLLSVVALYAAIGVAVPLVYAAFRGG
ncbi:unnamed protein product [Strongylus vulgaris]|uniref:Uncharacterized protein n=1 Tax=Strongylus vulgaris TaxID=40348 RepID=A0A3P7JMQ5_STRVU|nr:unnamed protein product [Strongylus vulgaris]